MPGMHLHIADLNEVYELQGMLADEKETSNDLAATEKELVHEKLSEAQASLATSNNRLGSIRFDNNGRHHVVVQAPPPGQFQYGNHGPVVPSQQQAQASAHNTVVSLQATLLKQRDEEIAQPRLLSNGLQRQVEEQDEEIAELNSTVTTLLSQPCAQCTKDAEKLLGTEGEDDLWLPRRPSSAVF
ncbi:hypothetical protein B0T24DRAFT_591469 [Lasiosphaeria ovina]|uniref:Uncharacterized protein n=1 Tax=Lasiosphaeria ovina TaxID=92902 RepID=A0AAE0KGF5_9PEZI|nr:hypothetical protein B0T24DRAFT_591469 [Lasiosphaeria ovina]